MSPEHIDHTRRPTIYGEVAELYDRARPSYPEETITDILALAPGTPRVVDVGAGTGRATLLFAARGAEVVAVEPSGDMARVAAHRTKRLPRVEVVVSSFEAYEPRTPFDIVACAQAWHWIDPSIGAAKAHAILQRDGLLALFWNWPRRVAGDLRSELDECYRKLVPEIVDTSLATGWRGDDRLRHELEGSGLFHGVEERRYAWLTEYSTAQYLELLRTHSDHRILPASRLEALLDAVAGVIEQAGGRLPVGYETELLLARPKPCTRW